MAGDWIAWTKGLPSKLEINRIAAILQVDRYTAACFCMAVWEWADANTSDGIVPGIAPADISSMVGIASIGEAMTNVGWIIVEGGGIRFPNWDRYNAESAKKRLQTRDRMRRHRGEA